MDMNNIALVRATDIIPFDGVVRPISNVPYLQKNIGLEFSSAMSDLLHELNIIPKLDYTRMFEEDYYEKMAVLSATILKDYLPYISDYNSMVLFSLNGLCPDDSEHGFGNNTFSNKKCAIIEPLSEHIEQVISLVPTDTAVKGDVYLSDKAIILIEEETYLNLSDKEKAMLSNLNLSVRIFKGLLKEAVIENIASTGVYTPEVLSLSASTGGIMPSETSEMHKELINNIAIEYGLCQKKYFDIIMSRDESMPKYEQVCDEYDKMIVTQDYTLTVFIEQLLVFLNAPVDMRENIGSNLHYKFYMERIIELIKKVGIEQYKQFVDSYNATLKQRASDGSLLTPQDIINNNFKKITK